MGHQQVGGWDSAGGAAPLQPSTSSLLSPGSGLAAGLRRLAASPGCPSASPSPDPPGSLPPGKTHTVSLSLRARWEERSRREPGVV